MILNVDASVLVLLPALAFVGFEWVRGQDPPSITRA
jgi:hypothetical protein